MSLWRGNKALSVLRYVITNSENWFTQFLHAEVFKFWNEGIILSFDSTTFDLNYRFEKVEKSLELFISKHCDLNSTFCSILICGLCHLLKATCGRGEVDNSSTWLSLTCPGHHHSLWRHTRPRGAGTASVLLQLGFTPYPEWSKPKSAFWQQRRRRRSDGNSCG